MFKSGIEFRFYSKYVKCGKDGSESYGPAKQRVNIV